MTFLTAKHVLINYSNLTISSKLFVTPYQMAKISAIPDRWIPYKACGNLIEGTRIICFKVPLRKSVQEHKPGIKEIWDIPALVAKIPNLGAVIDLTNTTRYYNPREMKAVGLLYKKILIPGRMIPPEKSVKEFMDTVDGFLREDSDFLVGVHCTHGLNRTGYLVCRYMRDRLGIPARKAIKSFEKARGYKIERDNYIADLLGKPPLPPDVGQDTKLKPLKNYKREKTCMTYKSPLAEDEYDAGSHSRSRYVSRQRDGSNYDFQREHRKRSEDNWRSNRRRTSENDDDDEPRSNQGNWRNNRRKTSENDDDSERSSNQSNWRNNRRKTPENDDEPRSNQGNWRSNHRKASVNDDDGAPSSKKSYDYRYDY